MGAWGIPAVHAGAAIAAGVTLPRRELGLEILTFVAVIFRW
jgi:hypothetical protein